MVSVNKQFSRQERTGSGEAGGLRMSDLSGGERARVVGLADDCQGFARRRLMDLGLTPGATVECAFRAPLGGPTAYRLRGVTLALRPEQARMVAVQEEN